MTRCKVIIADDHEVVRKGLRYLFEDLADFTLVAEASNAIELFQRVSETQPDIVIIDIRMPGMNGIDASKEILTKWPEIKVIVHTSFAEDGLILEAVQAGISGYVLKDGSTTELIRAMQSVRDGATALDPAITQRVLELLKRKQEPKSNIDYLTEREKDVLILISQGKTNEEIAKELVLSEKTIRNYISSLFTKLNVRNRVEAAILALQHQFDNG